MPRTRPILHTWAACGVITFAMLLAAFAVGRCCDTVITPKFAYVANLGEPVAFPPGSISMYSIETNGALKPLTPATVSGDAGLYFSSLAADPSGRFVYATNFDPSGTVAMYKINDGGTLTPMPEMPGAGAFPSSVAVDPLGRFVYVANKGNSDLPSSVSMYKINDGGTLTPIGPGKVDGGRFPNSLAVDPSGSFVYVANQLTNDVSMFQIDKPNGALNPRGAVDAGTSPSSVAVDPSGRFVYVANSGLNTPGSMGSISMYQIGSMGSLTPMAPATIPAGTSPSSLAIDPFGRFAYVANQDSKDVWIYTINDNNGVLTMRGKADAGTSPSSVAVDPSGRFVYVTSGSPSGPSAPGTVSMYSIDQATGALRSIGTVDAGFQPSSLAIVGSSR